MDTSHRSPHGGTTAITPERGGTTAITPERSARRDGLHAAVLAVPWALVVFLWWRVLQESGSAGLGRPLLLVTASLVVTLVVTTAWIAHNLGIHRAKGPRTGLPEVEPDYNRDWTGRPVFADWSSVRTAPIVFVAGAERQKTFVPSRGQSRHAGGPAQGSSTGTS